MSDFYLANQIRDCPPRSLESVTEYGGEEVISVSCTQMADGRKQRRLVREWCQFLPRADSLKGLFFTSRTSQGMFEAACLTPRLEKLSVKWSSIKDLSPILNQRLLWYLQIGSSPSAQNVESIRQLPRLRILSLENIRALYELDWLNGLVGLEELAVAGSLWTRQKLHSLTPLASLKQLRLLDLTNTWIARPDSLRELVSLRNLEETWLDQRWPRKGDIRYLIEHVPRLHVPGWPWKE